MNKISQNPPPGQPQKKYSCINSTAAPDAPRGREAGRRAGGQPSCLYSNISIENDKNTSQTKLDTVTALCNVLSPYHKKVAQTLRLNVERLAKKEAPSIDNVAFITLTFPDNVTDHKEAYSRFRSFNSNYFSPSPHFGSWVNTKERQKRGAWHYHIVVVVDDDIKTGFDFDAYKKWTEGNNRFNTPFPTGNNYLRYLWHDLGKNLEKYGLGKIFSLEPIHSDAEAISKYVGKYISKHMGQRERQDKNVRLVNYSRGWVRNYANFAWNTDNAKLWRMKLKCFAMRHGCQEFYQLTEKLGKNWAYNHAQDIQDIYFHLEEVVKNKDVEYVSPLISSMGKRKGVLPAKKTNKERKLELRKRQFEAELPFLVKNYIKKRADEKCLTK